MKNFRNIIIVLVLIMIGCKGGEAGSQTADNAQTSPTPIATPEAKTPALPTPPANIDLVTDGSGHQMVRVAAGEFTRGSDAGEVDERPAKKIFISEFLIDRYEVSNADYSKCVSAGRCRSVASQEGFMGPDQPVSGLSWDMANAYCKYVGERLPSEAEWEKAARGANGGKYPWGDMAPDGIATFAAKTTSPATANPSSSSPYGAANMAGNVAEWVNDWYDEKYYASSPDRDPKGPVKGMFRIVRGGSYRSSGKNIRSSYRVYEHGDYKLSGYGVRCAR